jgi:hypothetical protein
MKEQREKSLFETTTLPNLLKYKYKNATARDKEKWKLVNVNETTKLSLI